MVQKKSIISVTDRCGVWTVRLFHLYKGFNRKQAKTGTFVKGSVQTARPDNWIGRTSKVHGIIIGTRSQIKKKDGSKLFFFLNTVVLLKKRMTPRGKEIAGPIVFSLRKRKFRASFPGIV